MSAPVFTAGMAYEGERAVFRRGVYMRPETAERLLAGLLCAGPWASDLVEQLRAAISETRQPESKAA